MDSARVSETGLGTSHVATLRAKVEHLSEGPRPLDASTSHYLLRVLRLGVGDSFVAFDPHSKWESEARIVSVEGAIATVSLTAPTPASVTAPFDVWWIHALAKGDKLDAIVRDATELGATHILLTATTRSIVKVEEKKSEKKRARWQAIAEDASRQCGRADPPSVEGPMPWEEALSRAASTSAKFLLYEEATHPLSALLGNALRERASIAFAAGPEGGLTREEVLAAEAAGFHTVSLGRFILRTETVCAAVLGAVRIFSDEH